MNIVDPELSLKQESTVNREVKNSVFTLLLDDEDAIRDVARALLGDEVVRPDAKIEITTLEVAFQGKWRNDLSFLLDGQLIVLIEHQSTINRNMPLRMLYYICEIYKKFIKREDIYSNTKITIPMPYFIVLYNGEKDLGSDFLEYRLCDMFEGFDEDKVKPFLNLIVHVYDINKGHNIKIVKRSRILDGYVTLMAKIRENNLTMGPNEAMEKAVEECLKEGILTDFLNKHRGEIVNMLVTEWDYVTEKRVLYRDARQEGWQEGRHDGRQEQLQEDIASMYQEGLGVEAIARIVKRTEKDIKNILGL